MRNLFLISVMATLSFVVFAGSEKLVSLGTVSRSFPRFETVHSATFFYKQVSAAEALPEVELSVSLLGEDDLNDLAFFKKSYASELFAEVECVALLECMEFVHKRVADFQSAEKATDAFSIKFEFSDPGKQVVVRLDLTKNNHAHEAIVTFFGYAGYIDLALVNFMRAVMLDDTLLSKHWGKGLAVCGLASFAIWATSRSNAGGGGAGTPPAGRRVGGTQIPDIAFCERIIEKIHAQDSELFEEFRPLFEGSMMFAARSKKMQGRMLIIGSRKAFVHAAKNETLIREQVDLSGIREILTIQEEGFSELEEWEPLIGILARGCSGFLRPQVRFIGVGYFSFDATDFDLNTCVKTASDPFDDSFSCDQWKKKEAGELIDALKEKGWGHGHAVVEKDVGSMKLFNDCLYDWFWKGNRAFALVRDCSNNPCWGEAYFVSDFRAVDRKKCLLCEKYGEKSLRLHLERVFCSSKEEFLQNLRRQPGQDVTFFICKTLCDDKVYIINPAGVFKETNESDYLGDMVDAIEAYVD